MILITGATGTNGFEIVKLLSRMGVTCRALVRPSDKSAAFANLPGVEVAYGDFGNRETLAPALVLQCHKIAEPNDCAGSGASRRGKIRVRGA